MKIHNRRAVAGLTVAEVVLAILTAVVMNPLWEFWKEAAALRNTTISDLVDLRGILCLILIGCVAAATFVCIALSKSRSGSCVLLWVHCAQLTLAFLLWVGIFANILDKSNNSYFYVGNSRWMYYGDATSRVEAMENYLATLYPALCLAVAIIICAASGVYFSVRLLREWPSPTPEAPGVAKSETEIREEV